MIKYNNFLNEILLILKKLKIENIIVKLHPGENPHNLILLKFLKKYSNVVIYQTNNPEKLLSLTLNKNDHYSLRPDQKIFYDFRGYLKENRFSLAKKIITEIN